MPKDIDTSKHFFCAFGNMESKISARHIVRLCQKKNNWLPFTLEEIELIYNDYGKHGFIFNKLLSQGFILHRGKDYIITPQFIQKCYDSVQKEKDYEHMHPKSS